MFITHDSIVACLVEYHIIHISKISLDNNNDVLLSSIWIFDGEEYISWIGFIFYDGKLALMVATETGSVYWRFVNVNNTAAAAAGIPPKTLKTSVSNKKISSNCPADSDHDEDSLFFKTAGCVEWINAWPGSRLGTMFLIVSADYLSLVAVKGDRAPELVKQCTRGPSLSQHRRRVLALVAPDPLCSLTSCLTEQDTICLVDDTDDSTPLLVQFLDQPTSQSIVSPQPALHAQVLGEPAALRSEPGLLVTDLETSQVLGQSLARLLDGGRSSLDPALPLVAVPSSPINQNEDPFLWTYYHDQSRTLLLVSRHGRICWLTGIGGGTAVTADTSFSSLPVHVDKGGLVSVHFRDRVPRHDGTHQKLFVELVACTRGGGLVIYALVCPSTQSVDQCEQLPGAQLSHVVGVGFVGDQSSLICCRLKSPWAIDELRVVNVGLLTTGLLPVESKESLDRLFAGDPDLSATVGGGGGGVTINRLVNLLSRSAVKLQLARDLADNSARLLAMACQAQRFSMWFCSPSTAPLPQSLVSVRALVAQSHSTQASADQIEITWDCGDVDTPIPNPPPGSVLVVETVVSPVGNQAESLVHVEPLITGAGYQPRQQCFFVRLGRSNPFAAIVVRVWLVWSFAAAADRLGVRRPANGTDQWSSAGLCELLTTKQFLWIDFVPMRSGPMVSMKCATTTAMAMNTDVPVSMASPTALAAAVLSSASNDHGKRHNDLKTLRFRVQDHSSSDSTLIQRLTNETAGPPPASGTWHCDVSGRLGLSASAGVCAQFSIKQSSQSSSNGSSVLPPMYEITLTCPDWLVAPFRHLVFVRLFSNVSSTSAQQKPTCMVSLGDFVQQCHQNWMTAVSKTQEAQQKIELLQSNFGHARESICKHVIFHTK